MLRENASMINNQRLPKIPVLNKEIEISAVSKPDLRKALRFQDYLSTVGFLDYQDIIHCNSDDDDSSDSHENKNIGSKKKWV